MRKNEYFIKVYNSMITVDSKYKLTVNELFIYCYLYTLRTYENKIVTNYEILCVDNEFYKNKTDNKKEIKRCINSLKEKQLINIKEKNKSLTITFSFEEKGHVQITYDKFRTFTKSRDLYIYVAVSKWKKEGGARYSNNDWANLLDITREYAITVIEDACERGLIYKKVGTYTDNLIENRNQKMQEKNTYSIEPFMIGKFNIEDDESKVLFGSEKELKAIETVNYNLNEETHNWSNSNNLTENDFVFYLSNYHDKNIKEMCEKKINRILSKNNKFKFIMEDLIKEAEEKIQSNKRKEEEMNYEKVKTIIEETDDIVLEMNNQLISYSEYKEKGLDMITIEKLYYLEKEDISHQVGVDGAATYNLRTKVNPQEINIYRKENGQWKESFYIGTEELRLASGK